MKWIFSSPTGLLAVATAGAIMYATYQLFNSGRKIQIPVKIEEQSASFTSVSKTIFPPPILKTKKKMFLLAGQRNYLLLPPPPGWKRRKISQLSSRRRENNLRMLSSRMRSFRRQKLSRLERTSYRAVSVDVLQCRG
jgi:hypothetical protein